jgi:squalene-associated FAD-dependent desaturase
MPLNPTDNKVIIIGGGWAGLSAAVHLANEDLDITLIESANMLGGRARSVVFDDVPVDNGQHIAIGGYRTMLSMLQRIGLDEERVFLRWPLTLDVRSKNDQVKINAPSLPAPFHLLLAFMRAVGLSRQEKKQVILGWSGLMKPVDEDMTVSELLAQSEQPERVNHYLWEPLCLAAMNTPAQTSSATIFQRVLKDAFGRKRRDSDLLIPRYDLGRVIPAPAQDYLQQKNVTIRTGDRVTGLLTDAGKITGVQLGYESVPASRVIIATNPWNCAALIKPLEQLGALHENLKQFTYEPITTVYLKYSRPVLLQPPMLGLVDHVSQWLFDRRLTGLPRIIAAIISGDGEHMQMSRDELAMKVKSEIHALRSDVGEPVDQLVIREKRATFAATPFIEKLRPVNRTRLAGCWLAGDYTDTGYPSTLEGAVISGQRCAQEFIEYYRT